MTQHLGLWVEVDGYGRCRIDGNAHTFRGRVSAWSETLNTSVTVGLQDVKDPSPEVRIWFAGFLSGNEPEFHAFLGVDPDVADELEDEDEHWARYQAMLEEFRRTGALPFPLNSLPHKAPPAGMSGEPWTIAGGQVLRWLGSSWSPQQPQPEWSWSMIVGTVCHEREHHRMDGGNDDYSACIDCGYLSEHG